MLYVYFFFSSRRRHTRCALVTGVQTCALPILPPFQPLEVPMAAAVNDAAKRGWRPNPKLWLLLGAFVGGSVALTGLADWSDDHLFLVRSEEHTSELQSLMRISYAVFCLKKKKQINSK